MVDAAGPEPPLRDLEAAPLAQQDILGRYADILEVDLGVAVRRGTRIIDCCLWRTAAGSLFPMKMRISQAALPAPEQNHLCPLIR